MRWAPVSRKTMTCGWRLLYQTPLTTLWINTCPFHVQVRLKMWLFLLHIHAPRTIRSTIIITTNQNRNKSSSDLSVYNIIYSLSYIFFWETNKPETYIYYIIIYSLLNVWPLASAVVVSLRKQTCIKFSGTSIKYCKQKTWNMWFMCTLLAATRCSKPISILVIIIIMAV